MTQAAVDDPDASSLPSREGEGRQGIGGAFGLPDEDDDVCVLAATVVGGAGVIVTGDVGVFSTEVVPPAVVLKPAASPARVRFEKMIKRCRA